MDVFEITAEQLQAERDAWYANGLRNGYLRALRNTRDDIAVRLMVRGDTTVPVRLVEESV